jgi:hypothetical protein
MNKRNFQKSFLLSTIALGGILTATSAEAAPAGSIVFSGVTLDTIAPGNRNPQQSYPVDLLSPSQSLPPLGTTQPFATRFLNLNTVGAIGTGPLSGATSVNQGTSTNTFRVNYSSSPITPVAGDFTRNLFFNANRPILLAGSCILCGVEIIPSTDITGTGSWIGTSDYKTGRYSYSSSIPVAYATTGYTGTLTFNAESIIQGGVATSSIGSFGVTANGPSSVPGPIPLLGAASAFAWSRNLRKRMNQTSATIPNT